MGGKRPDQHNLDRGEAGATDYKDQPQVGRGVSSRDETVEGDRQRLAQSEKEGQGQPFPPDVPAPSQHARDAQKRNTEQGEREDE